MANVLFELFATLGLDTTDFKEETEKAIEQGGLVADATERAFIQADTEYKQAKQDLADLEYSSGTTGAAIDGIIGAVYEITEDAIEALVDYADQSIELFVSKGGEVADAYRKAMDDLDLTNEALQMKIGSVLVPVKTGVMELAAALSGIDNADKLVVMLDRLENYNSDALDSIVSSLDAVFGMFSTAEYADEQSLSEMTEGLESQAAYWEEYAETLENVRKRVSPELVAAIADGSASSLSTLQAMEAADAEELEQLMIAFEAVEQTKARAADGLHETQMLVDEDFAAMTQTVESLVLNMEGKPEEAYAAAEAIGAGVANGLANTAPAISAWVDYINSELSRIGAGYQEKGFTMQGALNQGFASNEMGFSYFAPHASGISYVPYNGYPALLHEGERVLTRQENADQRSGRSYAADAEVITAAVIAGLSGMGIDMDGEQVGTLVANHVSRQIARDSRTARRYG